MCGRRGIEPRASELKLRQEAGHTLSPEGERVVPGLVLLARFVTVAVIVLVMRREEIREIARHPHLALTRIGP